jgi:hypothetical protein
MNFQNIYGKIIKMDEYEKEIQLKEELDALIEDLEEQGFTVDTPEFVVVGFGDMIEATLNKFGITQERFKEFFNIEECNCTKRKEWLNGFFSFTLKKSKRSNIYR